MAFGLIGRKIGMTQVFDSEGILNPVTVVQSGPCTVLGVKTTENGGYNAVQIGFQEVQENRVNGPASGMFKKLKTKPVRHIREFRVTDTSGYNPGDVLDASRFKEKEYVDISGTSKGKGFQGVVKRWGMAGGPAGHGTHFGRDPGSTGMCEKPARILKNRRMPGHMGNIRVTALNLQIVRIDAEKGLLFVKGAVPGRRGSVLFVRKAEKKGT